MMNHHKEVQNIIPDRNWSQKGNRSSLSIEMRSSHSSIFGSQCLMNIPICTFKLMSTVDLVPKSYDRIQNIAGDPHCALGYIIHHFNINKVSRSLRNFPGYCYDQVYHLTYIDPTWYNSLQRYYIITWKQLQDALVQEWLELPIKYGKYLASDEIPIYLLDCFLWLKLLFHLPLWTHTLKNANSPTIILHNN